MSTLPWFEHALARRTERYLADGMSALEADNTARLQLTSLDKSTERGYASIWTKFVNEFCVLFGHEWMPISKETGMAYIRWQADRGAVHQKSLSGYLSVLNCAMIDCVYPEVFETTPEGFYVDKNVSRMLKSLAKAQGARMRDAEDNDRLFLPAWIPLQILNEVPRALELLSASDLSDHVAVTNCRDDLAVSFGYADFGRSDSQASFKRDDVVLVPTAATLLRSGHGSDVESDLLFQFRRTKGSTKNKFPAVFRWPASSNPTLISAVQQWLLLRTRLGPVSGDQFWRLPWDKALTASDFNDMLTRSLTRRSLAAPKGFVYTYHSVRAGAQSEAAALNVPITVIRHQGGYAPGSKVPETTYIDPSCPPSPAGAAFFGWLRPPPTT
jgi:hypothetical protein